MSCALSIRQNSVEDDARPGCVQSAESLQGPLVYLTRAKYMRGTVRFHSYSAARKPQPPVKAACVEGARPSRLASNSLYRSTAVLQVLPLQCRFRLGHMDTTHTTHTCREPQKEANTITRGHRHELGCLEVNARYPLGDEMYLSGWRRSKTTVVLGRARNRGGNVRRDSAQIVTYCCRSNLEVAFQHDREAMTAKRCPSRGC